MVPSSPSLEVLDARRKLLEVAVQCFLAQGYHGTGLQEILAKAKVPKGSFYHYFPSKEAFGAETISAFWESASEDIRACLIHGRGNPLQRIKSYLDAVIEMEHRSGGRHGCLISKLAAEMADLSPVIQSALRSCFEQWVALLSQCIRDGQTAGQISRSKTAENLARLFLACWQGAVLQTKIQGDIKPLVQCRDYLLEVLLVK